MSTKLRYYLDDGKKNPAIDTMHMTRQVHALFCQWVLSNYHVRDFLEALEHRATTLYGSYLLDGQPAIPADLLLPDEATLMSLKPFFEEPMTAAELKPRFYTAEGQLNGKIGLDEEFDAALAQLFGHWVYRGYHVRDFIEALRCCGSTVHYDYVTAQSLGGLGGGKTAEEYLTTRPK